MMTRRLLARLAPGAVATARLTSDVALKAFMNNGPPSGIGGAFGGDPTKADSIWNLFWNKRRGDAAFRLFQKRKQRHDRYAALSPNIMALRSVADQHKTHMMDAERERLEAEDKTLSRRIARAMGISDDILRDNFGIE